MLLSSKKESMLKETKKYGQKHGQKFFRLWFVKKTNMSETAKNLWCMKHYSSNATIEMLKAPVILSATTETKYSKMVRVEFVEDSLLKIWSDMGPFLNTFFELSKDLQLHKKTWNQTGNQKKA